MTAEVAPPLAMGRYRLIGTLGEGGMATVFLAYDAQLGVFRAVKVLNPELAGRRKVRERFATEARTMARIRHANIVSVLDVGVDGDRVYMVMEVVRGGCLIDRVQGHGPLAPRVASAVLRGVLDALTAAHGAGVIHRDIKPHNVLITTQGLPQVTDFGIARVDAGASNMTKTGAVMGTWTYMAPEQKLDATNVDERSDVFAASASLYAIVTGKLPVDLYAVEGDDELFAGIPAELVAVIRKGTAYKVDRRYASAAEMHAALLDIEASLPPLDGNETPLAMPALPLDDFVPDVSDFDHTLAEDTTGTIRRAHAFPPASEGIAPDAGARAAAAASPPPAAPAPEKPPGSAPDPPPSPPAPPASEAAPVTPPPPLPPLPLTDPVASGPFRFTLLTGGVAKAGGLLGWLVTPPRVSYIRLTAAGVFYATSVGATESAGVKGSMPLRPESGGDTLQGVNVRHRRSSKRALSTGLLMGLGGVLGLGLLVAADPIAAASGLEAMWVRMAGAGLAGVSALLLPMIPLAIMGARAERRSVWMFDLDERKLSAYRGLLEATDALKQSGAPIRREGISEVASNVTPPTLNADDRTIRLLPDRLVVGANGALRALSYAHVEASIVDGSAAPPTGDLWAIASGLDEHQDGDGGAPVAAVEVALRGKEIDVRFTANDVGAVKRFLFAFGRMGPANRGAF